MSCDTVENLRWRGRPVTSLDDSELRRAIRPCRRTIAEVSGDAPDENDDDEADRPVLVQTLGRLADRMFALLIDEASKARAVDRVNRLRAGL